MKKSFSFGNVAVGFALPVAVMLLLQVAFGLVQTDATWWVWVRSAIFSLCIGLTSLLSAKICKVSFASGTTLDKKPPIAHVGWSALCVLCLICLMLPLNNWLMDLIELCGLNRPSVQLEMNLPLLLVISCLIPSFAEEIVFRGVVANGCRNQNKVACLATSGALFAIFHVNPAQTLHQFVLGATLALFVLRSGSVWTSIIAHLVNNVTVVLLSYFVPEQFFVDNVWWFLGVGLATFPLCVVGYLFTTKSNWNRQKEQTKTSATAYFVLAVAVAVCVALWIVALLV